MEINRAATYTTLLLSIIFAGCSAPDNDFIQAAHQSVLQQLKDPDSAKFGEASVIASPDKSPQYKELRFVCGTVNAKNSLGGYAGASRYVVLIGIPAEGRAPRVLDTRLEGTPGDSLFSLTAWDVDCKVNKHA